MTRNKEAKALLKLAYRDKVAFEVLIHSNDNTRPVKSLMRENAMSFKHLIDNVKQVFHA